MSRFDCVSLWCGLRCWNLIHVTDLGPCQNRNLIQNQSLKWSPSPCLSPYWSLSLIQRYAIDPGQSLSYVTDPYLLSPILVIDPCLRYLFRKKGLNRCLIYLIDLVPYQNLKFVIDPYLQYLRCMIDLVPCYQILSLNYVFVLDPHHRYLNYAIDFAPFHQYLNLNCVIGLVPYHLIPIPVTGFDPYLNHQTQILLFLTN